MPLHVSKQILTTDKLPLNNRIQLHKNNYVQESITFGDQHGNTLKILASLITAGIVTINREDYLRFSELYKTKMLGLSRLDEIRESYNLFLAQRNTMLDLLNHIKPGGTRACVRFIGDIVCDRGADDGITMALLYKLDQLGIPVKILYSNHDIGLIAYMENAITTGNCANFKQLGLCLENPKSEEALQLNPSKLETDEAASLLGLVIGLDERKINWQDTRLHYETAYKNKLCLIDYEIDDSGRMYIYTHASVALSVLLEVAAELGVSIPNKMITLDDLASFIDALNGAFTVAMGLESIRKSNRGKLSESTGLTALAWSRNSGRNCTINPPQGFDALARQVTFVHGHGRDECRANNRHCIDDSAFKIIYMDGEEDYSAVYFATNTNINKQYKPNTQKTRQHTVESALQHRDYTQELISKIDNSEKNTILINIGSCSQENKTYQELPPFLNKMKKDSFDTFNIDPNYSNSNNNRHPVKFDARISTAIQNALANGRNIIIFDNTSQTGLDETHQFARRNLVKIGSNLEIIIGYGTHGNQMIPILHPRKDFFEQTAGTIEEIGGLASLYCNQCQLLHRTADRLNWMRDQQLITENESCWQESWGTFLVSTVRGQNFVSEKAKKKGIEVYFGLNDLEHIPLFQGHNHELTIENDRKIVLTRIIDTLIRNIEMKKNGRYSTRSSDWKSKLLTTIKTKLQQENVLDHHTENNYLNEIGNLCAQKRNIFHFWAGPHSVTEFEKLLQKEKFLNVPGQRHV